MEDLTIPIAALTGLFGAGTVYGLIQGTLKALTTEQDRQRTLQATQESRLDTRASKDEVKSLGDTVRHIDRQLAELRGEHRARSNRAADLDSRTK